MGDHEQGEEQVDHGDHEEWSEDKHDERWDKDGEPWSTKRCMCGSLPGRLEFVDGHGKRYKKKEHKGKHHGKKDIDIGIMLGLLASGILAGGTVVAVMCFVCNRKRGGVAAPPPGGAYVIGQPTTDNALQTHVVAG